MSMLGTYRAVHDGGKDVVGMGDLKLMAWKMSTRKHPREGWSWKVGGEQTLSGRAGGDENTTLERKFGEKGKEPAFIENVPCFLCFARLSTCSA